MMLRERIASQSEVIRAIVSGYSSCVGERETRRASNAGIIGGQCIGAAGDRGAAGGRGEREEKEEMKERWDCGKEMKERWDCGKEMKERWDCGKAHRHRRTQPAAGHAAGPRRALGSETAPAGVRPAAAVQQRRRPAPSVVRPCHSRRAQPPPSQAGHRSRP